MPTTATFYEYTGPKIGSGASAAGTQSAALSTLNFSAGTYADGSPIPITAGYCSLVKYISVIHNGVQPYSLSSGQYFIILNWPNYPNIGTSIYAGLASSYPTDGPSTNPLGSAFVYGGYTPGSFGSDMYYFGTNSTNPSNGSVFYNYYAVGGAASGLTSGFDAATMFPSWSNLTYGFGGIYFNIPYYAQPLAIQIMTNTQGNYSIPGSYTIANIFNSIGYLWSEQ